MCVDMCREMYVDMCICMCTDVCMNMCTDMCIDMHMHMCIGCEWAYDNDGALEVGGMLGLQDVFHERRFARSQ